MPDAAAASVIPRIARPSAARGPRILPKLGKTGWTGVLILIAYVLATLILPSALDGDPSATSMDLLHPPSAQHPFGTDNLGRDVFLQFLYGIRVSLVVGATAAAAAAMIGILVGAYAGFVGGRVDLFVMRVTEIFQVIPAFVLAAVIIAMWGTGIARVVMVIALLAWPQVALVVRAEVLRIKKLDFIYAARCLGYGETYVLLVEVIPNALRPVLALATLIVGQAILMEAGLSFLGLGDQSVFSWGQMLSIGQGYLMTAWWLSFFPGLAIFLTVLACNLLGDGMSGYLNPTDKSR
jgi:peptide/nickel transport system permease protein